MRTFLLLLLATCIHACDSDEVEYFCPETDFSERHELDTMFFGTWKWHYSIKRCVFQSTLIAVDTIWPNEFVPEIGSAYPNRSVIIAEELRVITGVDTQRFCITEWLSNGQTHTSFTDVTGYVLYRRLFEPDNRDYLVFSNHSALMESNVCTISPSIYNIDFCPSTDWRYSSTTTDYYLKFY
jgi:hypothetical protein